MQIVATSDTHNAHRKLHVPEGDVFVHAGDYMLGPEDDAEDFFEWVHDLPHKHKLVVPGNHDFTDPSTDKYTFTFCEFGVVEFDTVRFTCCSYTPKFGWWPRQWSEEESRDRVHQLPHGDVLVSHGPAYGVADLVPRGEHTGCPSLLAWVKLYQPSLHIHGHIHEGHGQHKNGITDVYNVAQMDESYTPVNGCTVISL